MHFVWGILQSLYYILYSFSASVYFFLIYLVILCLRTILTESFCLRVVSYHVLDIIYFLQTLEEA
jgi:hypothetical protein